MTSYLRFEAPPFDKREIERYAKSVDNENLSQLIDECIEQCDGILNYNVGFCELNFTIKDNLCDFGTFFVRSEALSRNIFEAKKLVLFVASIGHGIDRLIAKYSRTSPLKALIFNAIGTERVEALADSFVAWLEKEASLKALPRFSAGYGDLPLEVQKDIFDFLKPEKQIGVFLSDSFVMSPSKSVTAFVGLK
jgi:hypothetical protein